MSTANAELREPMSFEAFRAFLGTRPETERWELLDGQPVMMVGASRAHSLIVMNLAAALPRAARAHGCEVHSSDLFVSGGTFSGFLAAPDMFVRCGRADDKALEAEDPVIVVEVLSPSTIRHDRVRKFERYTGIASLRQIVFVYQDERRVESFLRENDDWPMQAVTGLHESVSFPFLDVALALTDVYDGTAQGQATHSGAGE